MGNEKIRYRRDLWKAIPPELHNKPIVEVGVAEGNFAEDMLNWPHKPTVCLVDRWLTVPTQRGDAAKSQEWHSDNLEKVLNRIERYGGRAKMFFGDSVLLSRQFQDRSLSLVNIDADHSYEGVKNDISAWFPKVAMGGVMVFHDFENLAYGVKRAVLEFCNPRLTEVHLLPEDKPEDAGAWFRC
jgi:hypothetical protein